MSERTADARLVELLAEVYGLLDLQEFRRGLMEALFRAIPCKWASINEVGPERVESLVHPHLDPEWFPRFAALAHENPLFQRWQRTRDGRAYRFSDVTTREALQATRLYREVYAPLGIRFQMSVSLPNEPDHVLAVVLHREERDFTDAERDLLDRARPFLIQGYRNALAYEAARTGSAAGIAPAVAARGLTAREAEVVRLVALGASNRAIGERLAVSERTVQKHLERAYRKLGVSSRSAAAALAWELSAAAPSPAP